MITQRPKFLDSPYFVGDPGNWHLKPGAPEDVVREFEDWKAQSDKDGMTEPEAE